MNRALFLLAASVLTTGVVLAPAHAGESSNLQTGTRLIVVEPSSQLSLQTFLNKGGRNPRYRVGEPIQIQVRPSQDAYLYLFSIEADGRIQLILPNRFAPVPLVRAGQTQTFPGSTSPFRFAVSPPYGQAQVLVVASKTRLGARDLAYFRSGGTVTQQTLQPQISNPSSRAIVVEPSDRRWVTRSLYYRVDD